MGEPSIRMRRAIGTCSKASIFDLDTDLNLDGSKKAPDGHATSEIEQAGQPAVERPEGLIN